MTGDLKKILIIDDEKECFEIIHDIINRDYECKYANNYRLAQDLLAHWIPNLIILDWIMPDTDGLTILSELKLNPIYLHIPIIMITGYMTNQEDLLKAYKIGVIDFIRKPFDAFELIARVNSVCQLSFYYNEVIQRKEKELLGNAIRISENIELMKDFLSTLKTITLNKDKNLLPLLDDIEESINSKISDINIMQFEKHFSKTYDKFFSNIISKHPTLTKTELRICAFLRLRLSSKEIAVITHTAADSVRVARTRLRTKLMLNRDENLSTYLLNF